MAKIDAKTAELFAELISECGGLSVDDLTTVTAVACLLGKNLSETARLRIEAQLKVIENDGFKFREDSRTYRREDDDRYSCTLRDPHWQGGHLVQFGAPPVALITVYFDITKIDGRTYEDVFVRDWLTEDCDGPECIRLPLNVECLLESASYCDKKSQLSIAEDFDELAQQIRGLPDPEKPNDGGPF